jgi:hypothetical protein
MRDVVLSGSHLAVTAVKLLGPDRERAVVAENLLLEHESSILCRTRKRAPNLSAVDRFLFDVGALFPSSEQIRKVAISLQSPRLLKRHDALVREKSRRLFSSSHRPRKPGPEGLSSELIRAIFELKPCNPRFSCPRFALLISRTFGIKVDKNVVRRPAGRSPQGSSSSVKPRIACGVLTSSSANRSC